MNRTSFLAMSSSGRWHHFWRHDLTEWLQTKGLPILLLLVGSVVAARLIHWTAGSIARRLDEDFEGTGALVRPETVKHRQAVAAVVSWVSIATLYIMVGVEITSILRIPIGGVVAPAAVLGGALGFGAQRIVQDLLSGFFIIAEKQYGLGDLVVQGLGVGPALAPTGRSQQVIPRQSDPRSG
jgi:moderate conductance mechanosensitive channel